MKWIGLAVLLRPAQTRLPSAMILLVIMGLTTSASVVADDPPHQDAIPDTAETWRIRIDGKLRDSKQLSSGYQYELRVYRRQDGDWKLLLNEVSAVAKGGAVTQAAEALHHKFTLPPLDENAQIKSSQRKRSSVTMILQLKSPTRLMKLAINRHEAERLGIEREIDELVSYANRRLAARPDKDRDASDQIPLREQD